MVECQDFTNWSIKLRLTTPLSQLTLSKLSSFHMYEKLHSFKIFCINDTQHKDCVLYFFSQILYTMHEIFLCLPDTSPKKKQCILTLYKFPVGIYMYPAHRISYR